MATIELVKYNKSNIVTVYVLNVGVKNHSKNIAIAVLEHLKEKERGACYGTKFKHLKCVG